MSAPATKPPKDVRLIRAGKVVLLACACHLVLLAIISIANALGPDRWWIGGLNMYLPQWVWGLPSPILLLLCLWLNRRWSWVPVLSLLWVAGPVMGYCLGASAAKKGARIRVMTHNAQWWQVPLVDPLAWKIIRANADIACIQDARGAVDAGLRDLLKGWNVAAYGQYVIASRFPLLKTTVGDISFRGEKHTYLRVEVKAHGRTVTVCTAHLTTPRDGLSALRHLDPSGIRELNRSLTDRILQAESIAKDLRGTREPLIVAGDLNAPIQSLACRKLLGIGLQGAFDAAGRGYGYTYGHTLRLRHSFARIDHILVSSQFTPITCTVGDPVGSDHRPVIADLILTE